MDDCRRSSQAVSSGSRVPLALFTDERIKGLSNGAKLVIAFMAGRTAMIAEKGWTDKYGNEYIEYPVQEISQDLNCGKDKAMKILAELEGKDAPGLIRRVRRGQGKPDMIYFSAILKLVFKQHLEVGTSDRKNSISQGIYNNYNYSQRSSNNYNFNPMGDIHIISNQSNEGSNNERYDGFDASACIELIRENINYDVLISDSILTKEYLDEIMEIITEVVYCRNEYIRVGKLEYPKKLVVGRFEKLNMFHIQYISNCLSECTKKVTNIKAYLLTSLFNAPATLNHYTQAEVNHDFYGS